MYKVQVFKVKHIASGTKIIQQWKHFQTFASSILLTARISFENFENCCNVTFYTEGEVHIYA